MDLPQTDNSTANNTAISGFGASGKSPVIPETQHEPEVSLVQQISDNQNPADLDLAVESLLSDAIVSASKNPTSPEITPAESGKATEPNVVVPPSLTDEPSSSFTFNAVSAFVAGLAVVGVVYAFAVQGGFAKSKSVVLGDSIESSK